MKLESLVIANQNVAVNTFPGLVHTARHTMGVGSTRSLWPNERRSSRRWSQWLGWSRNKVAVSEGAAGSPPFYGDNGSLDTLFFFQHSQCYIMDGFPSGQRGRTVNPLSFDFEGSNPSPSILPCPSGGTGRRTGLKILRGNTRTGSIPVSGT